MSTQELAERFTVHELVRAYEQATAEIREAFAAVGRAEERLTALFSGSDWGSIRVNSHRSVVDWNDPERALVEVRHQVWRGIIGRLEVRGMMSVARAKELDRQLERHELPEISERSVSELALGFQANLRTMLEEAVEEVFNWLRPRRSEHKTNSELEVPRKVILPHIVESWGQLCSSWRMNYHYEPELTALENVFSALDGKGQITKTHWSAISTLIRDREFKGLGETPYFKFKVYQNGNMHLEFRRLDLLARFNAIAGGRRLRPHKEEVSHAVP